MSHMSHMSHMFTDFFDLFPMPLKIVTIDIDGSDALFLLPCSCCLVPVAFVPMPGSDAWFRCLVPMPGSDALFLLPLVKAPL